MSYYDTKQALVQMIQSIPITGISASDIAYENNNFNPANKSRFIAVYFIPVLSEMMGKSAESGNEQRGILQVTVFIKLNSGSYDNEQLQIIDDILSGFVYNSSTVYNSQTVQIFDSSVTIGSSDETWFKRDVSINYLTFSER